MSALQREATVLVLALAVLAAAVAPARAEAANPLPPGAAQPLADPQGVAQPVGANQDAWLTMGSEFVGRSSGFLPFRNGFGAELGCASGASDSLAIGRLALPDGVTIDQVVVWRFDSTAAADLSYALFEHCLPSTAAATVSPTSIIEHSPPPAPSGYARSTLVVPQHPVDALQCSYYIQVDFGPGCAGGGNLRLLGVQVRWNRP
jgi:hypothetical protein